MKMTLLSSYTKLFLALTLFLKLTHAETSIIKEYDWNVEFFNKTLTIYMTESFDELLKIKISNKSLNNTKIEFYCETSYICNVSHIPIEISSPSNEATEMFTWQGDITINGLFLGKSKLCAKLILPDGSLKLSSKCQNIIVLRPFTLADKIFNVSIAIVVSIIYISFGACLDVEAIKNILLRPIGPAIGFSCQFILMPSLSFLIGYLLFHDNVNMWLGIFFSGVAPGGGASNMWTLLLKGNVNLSIIMTTISNFAAFAMMPLWIFTLGKVIFEQGNLGVPYLNIAVFSISLIFPLLIGFLIKQYLPNFAKLLIKYLKFVTLVILVYIMTFAILTNLYLFELFSWKIIVAGMGLPWFGYILSYLIALALRQNQADSLTISIETGLQNTGVSMFLLKFSLEQPEADLTSVIPVAVSFMTLFPLLSVYIVQKFCCSFTDPEPSKPKTVDPPDNPIEVERIMS